MQQYNKTTWKKNHNEDPTKENIKHYNQNLPQILDHPYNILVIGGSGSGKTNA